MKSTYLALALIGFGVFSAAKDARAACGSGLSCEVCDNGFSPTEMAAPLGPMTGDCTDQDISGFDAACLASSASQSTCSAWESSASQSCLGCLLTQDTAASWGFLVCNSTSCSLNTAGCVDVATNSVSMEMQAGGAGSCGDALNASYGCQDYACGTCTGTDFSTCDQSALTSECATYDAPVESTTGPCAALNQDAGAAAVCFAQDEASEVAMATYICGGGITPPDDAGTNPDSSTTNPDAGSKSDAGSKGDAGNGDAGSDAGGNFGGKGGCHCDAAGGGGDSLAFVGFTAALAAALARRKKR